MTATIATLPVETRAGSHPDLIKRLRALIVDPPEVISKTTPVLVYLHGKAEASLFLDQITRVCDHMAPPLQAWTGHLKGVTVVAPQAPPLPTEDEWNWRDYLAGLGALLLPYAPRPIYATGFSRGGLGVLQLVAAHPTLISKWAIIDAQPATATELPAITAALSTADRGWVRYGRYAQAKDKPARLAFATAVASSMACSTHAKFLDHDHGTMAILAYSGHPLDGSQNLYAFLGLAYDVWNFSVLSALTTAPDAA